MVGSRFHLPMEEAFQHEMAEMRVRRAKNVGWIAVVLFALFGVNDPTMLPDAYHQAWLMREITVPLIALCIFGAIRLPTALMRDVAASVAVVGAAISLALIAGLSHHPRAAHYHTGIILIAFFGNISFSMRRRHAAIASLLMVIIYAICLANIDIIEPPVRFNIWTVFSSSVLFSLIANFQLDHERRLTFLARSREQERNKELSHANEDLSHAVEMLKRLSTEDALTQIANRRELDYRLKLEWGRARRDQQPIAMIMIDVDCFKAYNDYYGHPTGDLCLQKVASVLKSSLRRSTDLVARFGGEEFVILMPNLTSFEASQIAECMRQAILALSMPHIASKVVPVVTASFGVAAMIPMRQEDSAALLAKADAALYRAKENGRNQIFVDDTHEAVAA